jgi:hypothetical protein
MWIERSESYQTGRCECLNRSAGSAAPPRACASGLRGDTFEKREERAHRQLVLTRQQRGHDPMSAAD